MTIKYFVAQCAVLKVNSSGSIEERYKNRKDYTSNLEAVMNRHDSGLDIAQDDFYDFVTESQLFDTEQEAVDSWSKNTDDNKYHIHTSYFSVAGIDTDLVSTGNVLNKNRERFIDSKDFVVSLNDYRWTDAGFVKFWSWVQNG